MATQIQTNFVSGEISDELTGRIDLELYRTSATKLENVYIDSKGGLKVREGTKFIASLNANERGKLVPFTSYVKSDQAENLVSGITLIPGSGEFVYDTVIQSKIEGTWSNSIFYETKRTYINYHTTRGKANVLVSLDNMLKTFPNLEYVSLVCNWFCDSIDAGVATVYPAVEYKTDVPYATYPDLWAVAGQNRSTARLIGSENGNIRYGGTPTDQSILRLITEITNRGLKVCFYPMVLVDAPQKPWRGRITGDETTVSTFFTKQNGYNNFISHYANLLKGKISAFIIGSELIGLTKIRSLGGTYPAVDRLVDLASQVKNILGSSTLVTYAADWSEYHHTDGGYYNLDKLWASPNIDFIGIDAYFPLTNSTTSTYDINTLKNGWVSGEGWSYYYSDANKTQTVPLTDPFAWKNIAYWHSNIHTDPGGIQTPWVPNSKPVWFTEYGFPSVDCASNQPNVFYSPGVLDSGLPIRSTGKIDNLAQYTGILATELQWKNSSLVQKKMLWTWDARPYPEFPAKLDVWADGGAWYYGHWVQGKMYMVGDLDERGQQDVYLLFFSKGKMDVFKNDTLIATITSAPISTLTTKQISEMKFAQSADTLIITHEDFSPIRILRRNHTTWEAEYLPLNNIPVYAFSTVIVSTPSASLTLSAVVGSSVTVTASSAIFNSTHIDQLISAKQGGLLRIKSILSGSVIIGAIETQFYNSSLAVGYWELETGYEKVWSADRGYPKTCCFFQDRLWFAGSKAQGDAIWASKISDYFNFDVGSGLANEAISKIIADVNIVKIRNLVAGRHLQIFTSNSEWFIGQENTEPITPENLRIFKSTSHGCSLPTPIQVDGAILFLDSNGNALRESVFNQLELTFNAKNINILAPNILDNPISMAVRGPIKDNQSNFVFIVNSTGNLAVLNILREQNQLAWSRFNTQGLVEDVCELYKDIYLVVKRVFNGIEQRLLEKLDSTASMDCSIKTYTTGQTLEHLGFDLFNNTTINVKADSFVLDDKTIINNKLVLSEYHNNIECGFNFSVYIKTLPMLVNDADILRQNVNIGPVGKHLSIKSVRFQLKDTSGFDLKIENIRYPVQLIKIKDLGSTLVKFSGWSDSIYISSLTKEPIIEIIRDKPVDFYLLSLLCEIG